MLTYPIIDDLGNAYRGKKNITLNLCGQGLMVRKRAIEKMGGWPYRSMTEDYELRMDGYLKGLTGMYYPYAELYSEEAVSRKEVYTRRMRWLTGYSQCDKKYMRDIHRKIKDNKATFALKFDMLCYKIAPIVFFVATLFSICCGCVITWSSSYHSVEAWLYLVCVPLAAMYMLLFVYTLAAMFCYRDVFKNINKQKGVRAGIDDYMVKPVDLDEMLLRIDALLRRAKINSTSVLEIGDVKLMRDEMAVYVNGEEAPIMPREFQILYKLLSYPKKIFTRSELVDEYWGIEGDTGLRTVDVYITKLRKVFAECKSFEIVTVHGFGYKAVIK